MRRFGLREEVGVRIAFIGTGYLGATHEAAMPELGHEVVNVDGDEATGTCPASV